MALLLRTLSLVYPLAFSPLSGYPTIDFYLCFSYSCITGYWYTRVCVERRIA
nr:MAG TPA: hypothetical protein [Caudoviricetes sp.]